MTVILGIDAAWTNREPSGLALVRVDNETSLSCVAIAPSYETFIELADEIPVDWNQRKFPGSVPNIDRILTSAHQLAGDPVDLVTLDMPVATAPITGRRVADNAISLEFGGRWCSAHTPNVNRPGPLGAALSQDLHADGYPLMTTQPARPAQNSLIEVYPHPALLSLLNRPQRVPYKVSKSTRYWPQTTVPVRIQNLLLEFNTIRAELQNVFGQLPFQLPAAGNVETLSYLKRYEDALDAMVCAWVGVQYLAGLTVPLGDDTAAIWCPQDVVFG